MCAWFSNVALETPGRFPFHHFWDGPDPWKPPARLTVAFLGLPPGELISSMVPCWESGVLSCAKILIARFLERVRFWYRYRTAPYAIARAGRKESEDVSSLALIGWVLVSSTVPDGVSSQA